MTPIGDFLGMEIGKCDGALDGYILRVGDDEGNPDECLVDTPVGKIDGNIEGIN